MGQKFMNKTTFDFNTVGGIKVLDSTLIDLVRLITAYLFVKSIISRIYMLLWSLGIVHGGIPEEDRL